jgi:hypothetical protein
VIAPCELSGCSVTVFLPCCPLLAAGKPSLVIPCVPSSDQPFWADLVQRRGLGPAWFPGAPPLALVLPALLVLHAWFVLLLMRSISLLSHSRYAHSSISHTPTTPACSVPALQCIS